MNDLEQKIAELKNVIGKSDEKSRSSFEEICTYLEERKDRPEVQAVLMFFIQKGMEEMQNEIEQLRQ